ncbi:MAG: nucleoside hydrolase [Erysipelotrichaceae bacterium]|nr:nucleoside hydrolase [Erysipelotrichaceae bacterium]
MKTLKKKLILDCDPGHDDAVAIMMAGNNPELDLLGITVVAGNQTLAKTVNNALKVTQHLDIDVDVYAGNARPLVREPMYAGFIHGESGLDGPVFETLNKEARPLHAVSFIINTLMNSDEKIILCPTGPLTNIAMAMRLEPRILEKIDRIVLMGGSYGFGNVTPAAEFNIVADPEAADIVFNSGVPIIMCGLDVTRKVSCYQNIIDRMNALGNTASTLFKDMMEFYNKNQKQVFGWDGGPLHDPVTIAYLLDESILKLNHCHCEVDTNKGPSYGRTNCDLFNMQKKKPNVHVAVDIDVDRFWDIVEKCLKHYS